jgi:sugar phosphate permease
MHVGHPLHGKSLKFALLDFLGSKRVWLIFLAMMGLTILTDFLSFVPIFLKETLDISNAEAAMTASAFPIGAFVSVLIGGYVFDSLSTKALTRILGGFLGLAIVCLLIILNLAHLELSARGNLYVVYACLFSFGFSISPAYYLPMSMFSIRYGGPYSGALISILDLGGYFATAIFAIVGGKLADLPMGWSKVLNLLVVIGIITLILTVWFLHNESTEEAKQAQASGPG